MTFITTLGMTNIRCKHPRFEQILWFIINDRGVTSKDLWTSICSKHVVWFPIRVTKFSKFINECQRIVMYAFVIEYGNKNLVYLWV